MEHIHNKSYVVTLCYGAFLQQKVNFGQGLIIMPMKPVYEECLVNYVSVTCNDFKISVDLQNLQELHNQIKDTRPVIALIATSELIFSKPQDLEEYFENNIYKMKLISSFISGDPLIEFARIIKNSDSTFFRMIPYHSRKRQKLFFSKEESDSFYKTAIQISINQEYFLSLLHDANHEQNPLFKIARYFGVLEAISNSYKKPNHNGSKDNIRYMLYNDKNKKNTINGQIGTVKYELDPIEIAYRFRNKFFHGGEPSFEGFKDLMPLDIWIDLQKNSNVVINSLQSLCEKQLMKEINKNKA